MGEREEGGVMRRVDDKKLKAISDIQRALGIIDGMSCVVENLTVADSLQAAVGMIEDALKEMDAYGKDD